MAKLHREINGYYLDNYGQHSETLHIYKTDDAVYKWGYSIGSSMTKGTFKTLKEAREKLL